MKCPTCLSLMKSDALFTSVKYECESLYCGLKEEHGWYFWNDFKKKYSEVINLDKRALVEYFTKNNSCGKLIIDNFNNYEYDETLKFRIIEEDYYQVAYTTQKN